MFKLRYLWFGFAIVLLIASGVVYVLNIEMYDVVDCYLPYTGFVRFSKLLYDTPALTAIVDEWQYSASPILSYVYAYCNRQVEWNYLMVGIYPALIGCTYIVCGITGAWGLLELFAGPNRFDVDEEEEDDIFQPIRRYR